MTYPEDISITDFVFQTAEKFGDEVALVSLCTFNISYLVDLIESCTFNISCKS